MCLTRKAPIGQLLGVKRQRVYIDTSVIGGCFDEEFRRWSLGLFRDFENGLFLPVVSELTAAEVSEAPDTVQAQYQLVFQSSHEYIELTEEAVELAQAYLLAGILSNRFLNDALHIAVASIASVDLVVSWNFKHIVHYEKIRSFNAVNLEKGYKPIEIHSPREVTYDE